MGILKVFLDVASALQDDPSLSIAPDLDFLFPVAERFAYIGNRKGLKGFLVNWVQTVRDRILELNSTDEKQLLADPSLGKLASKILANPEPTEALKIVYGPSWETNSGAYPDFILAEEGGTQLGDGAILELKDSKGEQIASFNSTIPTRYKSLRETQHVSGARVPVVSARLFDVPRSLADRYVERQRQCFYFVRTRAKDFGSVRLSLVEGSFFETVPKRELLAQVWAQILGGLGVDESEKPELLRRLGELEQSDIARSREIENASVKPRFRIMAEAHSEANPHRYAEIAPRTLNLILKQETKVALDSLTSLISAEGIYIVSSAKKDANGYKLTVQHNGRKIVLSAFTIRHKRNGNHLVIQFHLPPTEGAVQARQRTKPRVLRESQPLFDYGNQE